jgi:hypothetical protein
MFFCKQDDSWEFFVYTQIRNEERVSIFDIRSVDSLSVFRCRLKTFYFESAFGRKRMFPRIRLDSVDNCAVLAEYCILFSSFLHLICSPPRKCSLWHSRRKYCKIMRIIFLSWIIRIFQLKLEYSNYVLIRKFVLQCVVYLAQYSYSEITGHATVRFFVNRSGVEFV